MPKFGAKSSAILATVDKRLQQLFNEVIKHRDCSILEGRRSKERQNQLFKEKRSKLEWPNGKHNVLKKNELAKALDAVPYPIVWPDKKNRPKDFVKDMGRLYAFIGFVQGIAVKQGIKIRVGADWDGDHDFKDQNFDDLPHIELDE